MLENKILLFFTSMVGAIVGYIFFAQKRKHKETEMKKEWNLYSKALSPIAEPYYFISVLNIDTGICRHWDIETGSYRWVEAKFLVPSPEHRLGEMMIYVKDINGERIAEECKNRELQHALREVKRANQTRFDFIEYVTNDLQRLINSASKMNAMVRGAMEDEQYERAFSYTDRLESISEYLTSCLADILDISNMQRFGVTLDKKELDINQLMKECHMYLNSLRRKKQVSCMWIGSVEGTYIGDENRLKQCLFKLLENSVKYNRQGGSVHIEVKKMTPKAELAEDEFMVKIRDTGAGIPSEQIQNLYQPFNRGKCVESETEAPTGIGFAVVKHILDAMHGKLVVESILEYGTTVTVYFSLPRATETANTDKSAYIPVLVMNEKELNLKTG